MRLFLFFCLLLVSTSPAFAGGNSDSFEYQKRMVPQNQYSDSSKYATKNGKQSENSSPSRSFLTKNPNYDINVGLETGFRSSELKWNIASDLSGTTTPNILSELKWENVYGYEVKPSISYVQKKGTLKGLRIDAEANKSIAFSGDNQDSDYLGNNRTGEFSRSNNSSDAGHSEGFSADIGYQFDFGNSRRQNVMNFAILFGYAVQNQRFAIRDGFQTIPSDGSFADLRSSYETEIKTPFIAAEFASSFSKSHYFKIRGQISRGTYDGVGNWNLRQTFQHPVSFKHEADGTGFAIGAKYGWEFHPNMQLTLASNYNYFKTDDGLDKTYFTNGNVSNIRFNEARYTSIDYLAGFDYEF